MKERKTCGLIYAAFTKAYVECSKRLCPRGSVAKTCFGGREADSEQVAADEERSDRQERRVSPGEAEAAINEVIRLLSVSARTMDDCALQNEMAQNYDCAAAWRRRAEMRRYVAELLTSLLPEPDSKLAEQASGRRNAEAIRRHL